MIVIKKDNYGKCKDKRQEADVLFLRKDKKHLTVNTLDSVSYKGAGREYAI